MSSVNCTWRSRDSRSESRSPGVVPGADWWDGAAGRGFPANPRPARSFVLVTLPRPSGVTLLHPEAAKVVPSDPLPRRHRLEVGKVVPGDLLPRLRDREVLKVVPSALLPRLRNPEVAMGLGFRNRCRPDGREHGNQADDTCVKLEHVVSSLRSTGGRG